LFVEKELRAPKKTFICRTKKSEWTKFFFFFFFRVFSSSSSLEEEGFVSVVGNRSFFLVNFGVKREEILF